MAWAGRFASVCPRMLRLKAAAVVISVASVVACGGTSPPLELHTAADTQAVVPAEVSRPVRYPVESTTTTVPPTTTTTTAPPPPPTTTTTAQAAPVVQACAQACGGGAGWGDPSSDATWDRLAGCESGGDWSANTGNGYYGGIQFHPSSWRGVGGTGMPHEASREVQIEMGRRLWAQGGWVHWPACSSKLGYR